MTLNTFATAIGKGLVAGAMGTAAMTISSTLEAKARHRAPSTAPADAAGKLLGVQPRNASGEARFATAVHWLYGSSWGILLGLLRSAGVPPVPAAVLHYSAVWGSELVMLPALGVSEPVTQWGTTEIAIDAGHHVVYVAATSIGYALVDR
jgi:hypothetical protein